MRFRAPAGVWFLASFLGLVFLFCIGALVSAFQHPHRHDDGAEKVALFVVIVLLAALLYRISISATLIAAPSGIVVTTILRTYRLSWAEVQSFKEVVRPIGANPSPRRVLRVVLVDGRHRDFVELNCSRRRAPDVVADTARYLNILKPRGEPN